ncbi:MAG: hypothetical protein K2F80_00580, partial [Muribaculaceae bacterium]|nr:hypothetical protein [Muribaculaceae bacterium]
KAMFINTENECVIPTFRSSCSERLGLWISVAGIILLGIVSCFYNAILSMTSSGTLLLEL